jgi:hypothetical protein
MGAIFHAYLFLLCGSAILKSNMTANTDSIFICKKLNNLSKKNGFICHRQSVYKPTTRQPQGIAPTLIESGRGNLSWLPLMWYINFWELPNHKIIKKYLDRQKNGLCLILKTDRCQMSFKISSLLIIWSQTRFVTWGAYPLNITALV